MTPDAVKALHPDLDWYTRPADVPIEGTVSTGNKTDLDGIMLLEAYAWQGKVYRIAVNYDNSAIKWTTLDYTESLRRTWKLSEEWDSRSSGWRILCEGRHITVPRPGYLTLTDTNAEAAILAAKQADRRTKQQEFKP